MLCMLSHGELVSQNKQSIVLHLTSLLHHLPVLSKQEVLATHIFIILQKQNINSV